MVVRSSHRCRTMPVAMAVLPRVAEALWHGKKSRDNVRQKNRRTRVGNKDWEVGNDRREGWERTRSATCKSRRPHVDITEDANCTHAATVRSFPAAHASFFLSSLRISLLPSFLPYLFSSQRPLFPSFALSASRRKSIDRAPKKERFGKAHSRGAHTRTRARAHARAHHSRKHHSCACALVFLYYFRVSVRSIRARLFAPTNPAPNPVRILRILRVEVYQESGAVLLCAVEDPEPHDGAHRLADKGVHAPGHRRERRAVAVPSSHALYRSRSEVRGWRRGLCMEDIERKVPMDGHTERSRDSCEGREGT